MAQKKKETEYKTFSFNLYDLEFLKQALLLASQFYSSAAELKYVSNGAVGQKQRKRYARHLKKFGHFFALIEADISNGLNEVD